MLPYNEKCKPCIPSAIEDQMFISLLPLRTLVRKKKGLMLLIHALSASIIVIMLKPTMTAEKMTKSVFNHK